LLPIAERHHEYALKIERELAAKRIRVTADLRSEKIGAKIRDSQLQKIPYMVILGDKEMESGKVSVRQRSKGDLGSRSLQEFIDELQQLISSRAVNTN